MNPGFCDSNCLGRIGVVFLAGKLPNPSDGPAGKGEEVTVSVKEQIHHSPLPYSYEIQYISDIKA